MSDVEAQAQAIVDAAFREANEQHHLDYDVHGEAILVRHIAEGLRAAPPSGLTPDVERVVRAAEREIVKRFFIEAFGRVAGLSGMTEEDWLGDADDLLDALTALRTATPPAAPGPGR